MQMTSVDHENYRVYDVMMTVHPWFKHHRASHDTNEWFEIERQVLAERHSKTLAKKDTNEKSVEKNKKCEPKCASCIKYLIPVQCHTNGTVAQRFRVPV